MAQVTLSVPSNALEAWNNACALNNYPDFISRLGYLAGAMEAANKDSAQVSRLRYVRQVCETYHSQQGASFDFARMKEWVRANYFGTAQAANAPAQAEDPRSMQGRISSYFNSLTLPSQFYGNDGMPQDAGDLASAYELNRNASNGFLAVTVPGIDGNVLESTTNMQAAFRLMSRTQKAIDGLDLAISAGYLKGQSVGEEELRGFFPSTCFAENSPAWAAVRKIANIDARPANFDVSAAIDSIFASLLASEGNIDPQAKAWAIRRVVEANYGEGAESLSSLITDMGGTSKADALSNLKEFYRVALSDRGFRPTGRSRTAYPGSYSKVFDELCGTSDAELMLTSRIDLPNGMQKSKYGLAQIASLAYSYKNEGEGGYFHSDSFKNNTQGFLEAVCGSGNIQLPPSASAALLQGHATLKFMRERLDDEGFSDVLRELSSDVSHICSMPFGTTFAPQAFQGMDVSTRYRASVSLIGKAGNMDDNALLNDMVSRYLRLTPGRENAINLASPYELAVSGLDFKDIDNIQKLLAAMHPGVSGWSDLEGRYGDMRRFIEQNPGVFAGTLNNNLKKPALLSSPNAYINGISAIFNRMMVRPAFRPDSFSGGGTFAGLSEADSTGGTSRFTGKGDLNLEGPQSHIRANARAKELTNSQGNDAWEANAGLAAKNLNFAGQSLKEAFLNWASSETFSEGETISSSSSLGGGLRALLGGADFALVGSTASSEAGNTSDGNLQLDAIVRLDSGYARYVLSEEQTRELMADGAFSSALNEYRHYAEVSQSYFGGTFAAYESQRTRNPITPIAGEMTPSQQAEYDAALQSQQETKDRFGFVIGVEGFDSRLAALHATAPYGAGTYQASGRLPSSAVITAGYSIYKEPTSISGEAISSGDFRNDFWSGTEGGMASASILANGFYALAMGGKEVSGATFRGSNFGVGGLVNYKGGTKVYTTSGQYFTPGFRESGFGIALSAANDNQGRTDEVVGKVQFNLANGWKLGVFGTSRDLSDQAILQNQGSSFEAVESGISALADEISAATEGETPVTRAQVKAWAGRLIPLVDRMRSALPGDVFGSLENEFAFSLTSPAGVTTKVSIASVKSASQAEDGASAVDMYLCSMTSVLVGNASGITFTAGVPVDRGEGSTSGIKEFAGIKLNVGRIAFGTTGYTDAQGNLQSKFSLGYSNPRWLAGGSFTPYREGDGYYADFVLGVGRKVRIGLEGARLDDVRHQSIAAEFALDRAASWMVAGGIRNTAVPNFSKQQVFGRLNFRGDNEAVTAGLEVSHDLARGQTPGTPRALREDYDIFFKFGVKF